MGAIRTVLPGLEERRGGGLSRRRGSVCCGLRGASSVGLYTETRSAWRHVELVI